MKSIYLLCVEGQLMLAGGYGAGGGTGGGGRVAENTDNHKKRGSLAIHSLYIIHISR
jgi:hypothetical protein